MIGAIRLRVCPVPLQRDQICETERQRFPSDDLGQRCTEEAGLAGAAVQRVPSLVADACPEEIEVEILESEEQAIGERFGVSFSSRAIAQSEAPCGGCELACALNYG